MLNTITSKRNTVSVINKLVYRSTNLAPSKSRHQHASRRMMANILHSIMASAQQLSPLSSFNTRVMSSSASRTRISKGASFSFTSCLRRGRKIMPPSPGPYDRLMNSGRPARESLSRSVPGIPQLRSAPKFSQDEM